MKMKFSSKQVEDLIAAGVRIERFDLTAPGRFGYTSTQVDLSKFDIPKLESLFQALTTTKSRGFLTMSEDLRSWISSVQSDDPDESKVRTVRQLEGLLINAFKKYPRHHLYQSDEARSVWFAYYVERIEHHERSERDHWVDPEHVDVQLAHTELDLPCRMTIRFEQEDCMNQSVSQVLKTKELYFETDRFRRVYEASIEMYTRTIPQIGKQFLGIGVGTDDLDDGSGRRWYSRRTQIRLDRDGDPAHVVVDIFRESDEESQKRRDREIDRYWWSRLRHWEDSSETELEEPEIPIHPMLAIFDLRRQLRLRVHIDQLTEYIYNPLLGEKLILPIDNRHLIDILLQSRGQFEDIIQGKGGGAIILCTGIPGTGKTLTAEVYAEVVQRPLYTVQCSQLGLSPQDLEASLLKIFARSQRWNAILLLDEADVYISSRGSDLVQNAIVGVFLRTLEYYRGVLFLTTNRSDLIDDAVASRCLARIEYLAPTDDDAKSIWRVLADVQGLSIGDSVIDEIIQEFPRMTGRDIKNILKLLKMIAPSREILIEDARFVKRFKPTV